MTRTITRTFLSVGALVAIAPAANAQTNVDPSHKVSWSENCGWMNWHDAGSPLGSQGVRVHASFVSGFIWCQNIGWINVGDGTPGGGAVYTNGSGSDAGVNILAGGNLAGYAWGENVGWINFDTAAALGAQRARFDAGAGRLRGYAWGENIGWVNLDDSAAYVGVISNCYPNCDASTGTPRLTANDFQCFLNKFAAQDPYANCDASTGTPSLTANDFQCFLNSFAAGCS